MAIRIIGKLTYIYIEPFNSSAGTHLHNIHSSHPVITLLIPVRELI